MTDESPPGLIGFLATAGLSAVSLGLVVITATVLGVDALRADRSSHDLNLSFNLLVLGTLTGVLLAAYAAWRLLAPVESAYRRGVLSLVCAFATIVLMLICIPINQVLGRTGLFALLIFCALAAAFLARRAHRLGART